MTRSSRRKAIQPNLSVLPIALYARLSWNKDGKKDSVATQIKQGRRWIESRWPDREIIVYSDDDLSASDDELWRPGFEQMLEDVKDGKVGAVVARYQSRISRSEMTWPRFKQVLVPAGHTHLYTWLEGDIGVGTLDSLGGDVNNMMNARQAAASRQGVLDTIDSRFDEGRPSGGRAYGYKHVRGEGNVCQLQIVEDQAKVIRLAARMLLDGYSPTDVARKLNADKVPTPRGGKAWTAATVRRIVTKETVAGIRVAGTYEVVNVRVVNGRTRKTMRLVGKDINEEGKWEAILDRPTWLAVNALFAEERTIKRSDGRTTTRKVGKRPARTYLLTGGTATCGLCGTDLSGGLHYPRKGEPKRKLECHSKNGGCNRIGTFAEPLEGYVRDLWLDFLRSTELATLLDEVDVDADVRAFLQAEKATLEARIDDATDRAAEGLITAKAAGKIEAKVTAKLAEVQAELDALEVTEALGRSAAEWSEIADAWDSLPLPEQRMHLRALEASVVVHPAFGPRGFNPGRYVVSFMGIEWALPDEAAA